MQVFDTSFNRIGAEGARGLGPHLASLLCLQHLYIVWKDIGVEVARGLGPHLANLSSLQQLSLNGMEILYYLDRHRISVYLYS